MNKQAMQTIALHFGNPVYVDLRENEVIIRFASKNCLSAFMAKVSDNGINANKAFM